MSDIKTHCYSTNCGPIVITGFNKNYKVCKQCKSEITERLAEEIEERIAIKNENSSANLDELSKLFEHKITKDDDGWFY